MTGIFKVNNPSGNVILFFYALVLKLPMFLNLYSPRLQASDGILYKYFLETTAPIAKVFPYFYGLLTFLLMFIQALSLNRIVNNQRLHKSPNYLTGMSFLLITSLFSELFSLSAPLIVNSFILWIWGRLCSLYNNQDPKATIFNIGFLSGIAAFFYLPSAAFLLLIIAGIAVARPFRVQEWITALLGILTPVYFFLALLYLTDNIKNFHFPGLNMSYPGFYGNPWAYAALILIGITIITGIYHFHKNAARQIVQTRKSRQLLYLYIIIAAPVPFLNAGMSFSYWILTALPLSPVIASAFLYPRHRIFPLLLHWAMFAIYIAVGFFFK